MIRDTYKFNAPKMTLIVDLDSNLPGTFGEIDTFLFKYGKREIKCTKEELFDAIERLLHV